ncbi:MAG: MotA/TolQ/ExbB proton channel family protein [Gammaproteobacteria bacterium]|nr:MotA/TolQ/ExbB proton channel family protein [Gammaproteobacteria bacterium]MBU1653705.1 MotA/TolQ/ExbB proton channel family protein [Gammaproteobacteria bacterium]MBU1962758.1 MotA/TolQ/ExbB proton channel family protein [Gammaproteobacteria bacterium]
MSRAEMLTRGRLLAAFMAFTLMMAAGAAAAETAKTLDQVLREAQQSRLESQRPGQSLPSDAGQLQPLLDKLKAQVAALEAETQGLVARTQENQSALAVNKYQMTAKLGTLDDMFLVARQVAGDAAKQLADSLISGELAGRDKAMAAIAANGELADLNRVGEVWLALLREMKAQAEIKRFTAPLIGGDGTESQAQISRIGPFVAVKAGQYLEYVPDHGRFRELGRQPGGKFLDAARNLERPDPDGINSLAIDPSRGSLLALLVQTPDLEERIRQGGLVGYVIMGLAGFGILLALERIFTLRRVSAKVERQRRDLGDLRADNPLGRVLLSVNGQGTRDVEIIETKLDEAILKEIPPLEWGLPLVKLLASISTLLGLLGTVTGMILTFQAISLFGSGDPKLMAGGISQALVTTVQGLVSAIPLLLLHSIAHGSSRRLGQTLEEQAAALVAERMEAGAS